MRCARCVPSISAAPGSSTSDSNQKSGRPIRGARFFHGAEFSARPGRQPVSSLPDSCAVLPPGVPVRGGKSCPVRLSSALARPPAEPLPPAPQKADAPSGTPAFFMGRSFPHAPDGSRFPPRPDFCAVLPPGVPVRGGKSCPVRLSSALARPPAEPLPHAPQKADAPPGTPAFFIGRSFPPLSPFPPENRGTCYRSITASQQR